MKRPGVALIAAGVLVGVVILAATCSKPDDAEGVLSRYGQITSRTYYPAAWGNQGSATEVETTASWRSREPFVAEMVKAGWRVETGEIPDPRDTRPSLRVRYGPGPLHVVLIRPAGPAERTFGTILMHLLHGR